VLACALAGALAGATASTAQTSPESAKAPPNGASGAKAAAMGNIEFYLARGEADACGRGCNEWIAAQGKIDPGAASRLRQLLAKLGRARPPIYFHSPGGSITGSLELGRLIHDQKLVVSIGHTIAIGCAQGKPGETSCERRSAPDRRWRRNSTPTSPCAIRDASMCWRVAPSTSFLPGRSPASTTSGLTRQ
jgi:hypothetical protein